MADIDINQFSADVTEAVSLSDPSTLTIEELTKLIGAQRSIHMRTTKMTDVPRTTPVVMETRVTRSRTWCKLAEDGFTHRSKHPAMTLEQIYDRATWVVSRRLWTFLDVFSTEDRIVDTFDVNYPCSDLEIISRDITRAWHLYNTGDIKQIDYTLLSNTPLSVEVDNKRAYRYGDLWGQLQPHTSAHWRVSLGRITSKN